MKKQVFSIYDTQADLYDRPMVFDDEKVAISSIRRDIRDMYLRKDVTFDALRDRQLRNIGQFDTNTGFIGDDGSLSDLVINLSTFVGDLVVDDEI